MTGRAGTRRGTTRSCVASLLCSKLPLGAVCRKKEPADCGDYSVTHRPDLALLGQWVGDLKLFSPIGSEASEAAQRGACVGFGNTRPHAQQLVCGWRERGSAGDAAFDPVTGEGRVEEVAGDYAHARANGLRAIPLLFEVFGGWSPEVEAVFGDAVFARSNKLTAHEYEETTWSARTWLSFVHQQVSVALHRAVAWEIGSALGAPSRAGADPRGAYRPHVVGG